MFKDLSKYGFLNAKIRSKIGNIISDKEFEDMRLHKNCYEIINSLIEKGYISKENKLKDITNIEFELFKYLIRIYQEIYNYISERNLKRFIFKLMEKLEIENLKNILRAWFKRENTSNIDGYIYKEKICYEIPVEKLIASQDIDEFRKYIINTPFFNYMCSGLDDFKKTGSLFYLEISLDKGYFFEVFSSISLLAKETKKLFKNL